MRLSDKERRLCGAIELRGMSSVAELAGLTKLRTHTVSYLVKKLEDRRIIGSPTPTINTYPLGICHFGFFIKLQSATSQRRKQFVQEIKRNDAVVWGMETGGSYHYAITIAARDPIEASRIFGDIKGRVTPFATVSAVTRLSVDTYGRKYISELNKGSVVQSYGGLLGSETLDQQDKAILHAFVKPEIDNLAQIAKETQIPLSTVVRRVKRLEEHNIITGYYRGLNPIALGMQTYNISVRNLNAKNGDTRLRNFARAHPNIVHLVQCLGSWEYELVVECENPSIVSSLVDEMSEVVGEGIDTEILPVFDYVKFKIL